jgi:hypothetical protein
MSISLDSPINLFHSSHDLAQNSVDTYPSALLSIKESGLTSLSSIPTCHSADRIHVSEDPSPQTTQDKFPLSERSLLPTRLR